MRPIVASLADTIRKAGILWPFFAVILIIATSQCPGAAVPSAGLAESEESRNIPPAEAVQAISGSPYAGVIDCVLLRPLNPNASGDIHINYPSFGNKAIDEDIRTWVADMADAFTSQIACQAGGDATEIEAVIESVLNSDTILKEEPARFELWGAYKVSWPSDAAVSIAFELWNYTGAPEGNLDILTLNYSLLTGQRLGLVDIFEKPDVALELMSAWSRKVLESRLGSIRRARMLAEGTEPLIENFSSFLLTPDGICINFQPWQVAPQDAGIQRVLMPLKELMPSAPLLALWGKGEANEQTGTD